MAFRTTLNQRIFSAYKFTVPSLSTLAKCPGEKGVFRRYLHRSPASKKPDLRSLPTGEKLREKLRGMDITRDRIRLDQLSPPIQCQPESEQLKVGDAKKLLRLTQLEMVKSRLKQIEKSWISCSDFLQICKENCLNVDQAQEFAKLLDESGDVIVLGNAVFLRPQQVVKAMQELMPMPIGHESNDDKETKKEFQELEKQKEIIDKKAESLVKKELWIGLSYFIIQTTAFMKLTFWDLTWDVMEPICFFVTTIYCMGGYGFFLKTSKEPTFEGFFKARFSTKQKQLMKVQNFDRERYNELRKAYYPHSSIVHG